MAEWDDHHYCPKCRDDWKSDDPRVNSADCSDEQKRKIRNGNRYKSKKDQNSSVFLDSGSKDGSIDDSLLDEDESSTTVASQVPSFQKNRSLEDKLDRFFNQLAYYIELITKIAEFRTEEL